MSFSIWWVWLLASTASSPVIDGQFEDWPTRNNRDSWSIQSHVDDDSILLFLQQPGPATVLQQLDEPLRLGLDVDDNIATGSPNQSLAGCDLIFEMSPDKKGRRRGGVTAITWNSDGFRMERSPYKFGFVFAPTTASRRHEIRIDRKAMNGIGNSIRAVVQPGTDARIEHVIAIPALKQASNPSSSVPRKSAGSSRVISWNIEYGGILKKPDLVRSVLQALKPDILLLQEFENDQSIDELKRFLDSIQDGDDWTLAVNRNTGNLRSAVATRLPAVTVEQFDRITRSDEPDRTIRAAALLIDLGGGHRTLAVSVHLKCCGGLNGPEDMTRISEMLSIREAIESTTQTHQPDGLLIGGDLNLVASPIPLDILRLDGQSLLGPHQSGDLDVASPLHIDGRDAYTWYNAESSYTPGRLDYVLTGGDLKQTESFIFDSYDLDANHADKLAKDATRRASDHLPVVVDVVPAPN